MSSATVRWDKDAFWERVGEDPGVLGELLDLYRAEYPRKLADLRQAIAAQDHRAVRLGAHNIRGIAVNFSASAAAEISAALEQMGASGNLSTTQESIGVLAAELSWLEGALEQLLQDSRSDSELNESET